MSVAVRAEEALATGRPLARLYPILPTLMQMFPKLFSLRVARPPATGSSSQHKQWGGSSSGLKLILTWVNAFYIYHKKAFQM